MMKRFFILAFIIYSNSVFSQTTIKEKKYKFGKKDYGSCYTSTWDLTIPKLSTTSTKDIRHKINDSINKIVKKVFADTLEYLNTNIKDLSADCDTASISFTNSTEYSVGYSVGQNSERILSFAFYVNIIAGGGGTGFMTDYYSFNIELANNKLISIHSLFDSANTQKLEQYVIENIESPNEGISFDEDFNIFGNSEDYPNTGSYHYVGFTLNKKSLILNYSYDFGRGNAVNDIAIPLTAIKPFINKKYLWICDTGKK